MKESEAKVLLDSFYKGETSLEEEEKLYAFFEKAELDADRLEEREVFMILYDELHGKKGKKLKED